MDTAKDTAKPLIRAEKEAAEEAGRHGQTGHRAPSATSVAGDKSGQQARWTQPDGPAEPPDRLIVALDFPSADEAIGLIERLQGTCRWFKVGMELYYAAGRRMIEQLSERGFNIFLDLKLHDIPNTAAGAVRSLSGVGASLLTVHAMGGEAMMRAAAQAANAPDAPSLLAVTVLTSMDGSALDAVGMTGAAECGDPIQAQVLRLARLARTAGIDGLVCSAQEVAVLRQAMGPRARLVVPGIRPAGGAGRDVQRREDQGRGDQGRDDQRRGVQGRDVQRRDDQGRDDQRRVATATEAIERGASMLVVGRPITRAADPALAAAAILAEIASAS